MAFRRSTVRSRLSSTIDSKRLIAAPRGAAHLPSVNDPEGLGPQQPAPLIRPEYVPAIPCDENTVASPVADPAQGLVHDQNCVEFP